MANSQEPKHPPATPSSGQGSKIVRSPILRPEVNPDDATPTQGPRPRRHLPAQLGCDRPTRSARWVLWALGADAVAGGSESLSAVAECWTGRLIQVGRSSWQSLLYLATIWSLILS